jgi:hypothetical protein
VYRLSASPFIPTSSTRFLNAINGEKDEYNHIRQSKYKKQHTKPKSIGLEDAAMKLWPQKRWKKIMLITLLVVLAALGGVFAYLEYSVYHETPTDIQVLNADGAKTALVLYHPGLTDYAKNITYTYAQALADAGWRVEVTTPSPQAPTDIAKYKLLVLGWAIYDFGPAPTITSQIQRIGNLNGTDTAIIIMGGGLDPLNVKDQMNRIVEDADGNVIQTITSFRSQRNFSLLQEEAAKLAL